MGHLEFCLMFCDQSSPVGVLLVFDIQVLERGNERLSLEPSGGASGHRGVTYGALCADGSNVASQRCSQLSRLVPGLGHAADVEAAAEINAVQNLRETCTVIQRSCTKDISTFRDSPYG